MKNTYRIFLMLTALLFSSGSWAQSPQYFMTGGTAGNWIPFGGASYQSYRSQFLYSWNNFNAVPPSGMMISKIYFKVNSTGSATFSDLKIGFTQISNSISQFTTGTPFYTTTVVYSGNPTMNGTAGDWVSLVLTNPFPLDPGQNFIWDCCMSAGSGSGFPANCNTANGIRRLYQSTGSCLATASLGADTYAPDIGFDLIPAPTNIPKIPPLANFKPKDDADTLWVNSPSILVNTSSYSDTNYWVITGFNATTPNGTWTYYFNAADILQTNTRGTWIDTTTNKTNFYYTFPYAGYYRVKLFTANKYGTSFVEKVVFVSNAVRKPRALFFSSKQTFAKYDRSQLYDLSEGGPTKWKWWIDPPCVECSQYGINKFFYNGSVNDSAANPFMQAMDAGTFKVCLAVSNSVGADTLCQPAYFRIFPGYQMCSGGDSVGFTAEGAVMPAQPVNAVVPQYYAQNCAQGFRITPCADTIYVSLDRLRLRNNGGSLAPGDSLYLKSSILPGGGILRRWGGNDINNIKDSLKTLKFSGSQLWVVYVPAAPQGPTVVVSDSGFLVHWTSAPATYAKPVAKFNCPDTVYSGYKVLFDNKSTGKNQTYAWDINNDYVYGKDKPLLGTDSVNFSPSIIYNVTKDTTMTVCLRTYNCVGSDTFCKTMLVRPTTLSPFADFTVNKFTGLTTDTFFFTDLSYNGANKWKWEFAPANVTFLGGTDANSQNPMVFLNTNTSYTVTLTATNAFGFSVKQKSNYVTTISYPSPGSSFPPTSSVEDFGIVRVVMIGSIGKIDTITPLKPLDGAYSPMFNLSKTTVYRGGRYKIEVYRGNNPVDSMNLRVWADFNRNASYLDQGELLIAEDNKLKVKYEKTFDVPADASIGASRILVGASANFATLSPFSTMLGCYEEHGMIIGKDIVKPVVNLKGYSVAKTELGKQYIDSGATATDNIEGDISGRLMSTSDVDVNHIGYYTVKYYVTDYYGNVSDTVVRTVQVEINQTGPHVSLNGSDTVYIEVRKESYVDAGAVAKDNKDNDISNLMQITTNLDTATVGIYYYRYIIEDAFGFRDIKNRIIVVRDSEKPTIHSRTLNDTDYIVHQIKTPFDENAYIRIDDNYWSNLAPTRKSGTIDIDKAGIYELTYNAKDGSNNLSSDRTFRIHVTNTFKPTMTLIGASDITIKVFSSFSDPKAVAKDYFNNPVAVDIVFDNLRLDSVGTYYRIYRATDEYGQWVEAIRYMHVKDLDKPIITVLGDNPVTVVVGTMTNEQIMAMIDQRSIKVTDNYDPHPVVTDNLGVVATNFSKPGTYNITYDAIDVYGNSAQQKSRFLRILPTTGIAVPQGSTNALQIYPNPSKGVFNIDLKQGEIRTIKVYNIAGSLIKEVDARTFSNNGNQIDLSNEVEGIYLIRIESTDKAYTSKVTISR